MKIYLTADYAAMSRKAASIIASQVILNPESVLGLATGSTPVGTYKKLVEMNKAGIIDFSEIKTVNLDEYYPISPENKQSYRYFMNENLFDHVNINKANTYVPDGMAENADLACENHEKIIRALGGIDIQVLGIGQNGHIGFNEPEENLSLFTHKTALTENTIQANSRFFSEDEVMPTMALTMGMGTIFSAKKILLLINGKNKREAFEQLFTDKITTSCPATLLKLHPNVTILCDSEAYGE